MGAIVNASWQGWPKPEPEWKREKEHQANYKKLLDELTAASNEAAKDDIEALDYLMHKVTQAMCYAYQHAKDLHDSQE